MRIITVEVFAKIHKATCNQQYIDRNDFIRLYIAPWSDWNRILQNPELKKMLKKGAPRHVHDFGKPPFYQ
ncbi:hypothetical protein [Paenibacillus sp. RC253]|uniref:hypothetical protein n=1 Tax=Paenibacillus sp. RC253 TaxID=3156313 RepID=UPI0038333106